MPNSVTKRIKSAPKQKGWFLLAATSLILIILISFGFYLFFKNVNSTNYVEATIANQEFKLELADTDAKRKKGLSERNSLPEGYGMLFDFKEDSQWGIWMVQMRFPIDILWLNTDKQIVHIKENARPADFPEVYKPDTPARYVIELNSGAVQSLDLTVDDNVSFDYE